MKLFSYKHRPPHLGPYPLERLRRGDKMPAYERKARVDALEFADATRPHSLAASMTDYVDLLDRLRDGVVTDRKAPIPDEPAERARHLKAAGYYLDASQMGVCALNKDDLLAEPIRNPSLEKAVEKDYGVGASMNAMSASIAAEGTSAAWQRSENDDAGIAHHGHALVVVVAFARDPDEKDPSEVWLVGTQPHRAALRAGEVAVVLSQYLRLLGHEARAHTASDSDIDTGRLLLASGLGEFADDGTRVVNPYLGDRFAVAVVTTTLVLEADKPLAPRALADRWRAHGPAWWFGKGGTRSAVQGEEFKRRAYRLSRYPMEKIRTVDVPTTLIDAPNVPRVPKRHDMFIRAAIGDLGPKAEQALANFRMNKRNPLAHAMMMVLGGMVSLQYGKEAEEVAADTDDPAANADAVKAALNYLGADLTGICEIPEYAWYSHDHDGSEIKPYHKYAITILVNQGHETMDGASGDDWVGSAQGMRAYMRSTLVSGVVAAHIRSLGYSARTHSVIDQDVLQIPLMLLSGLGELGRLGEVVLNPFIGPSSKSSVITTDMPLAVDAPIDFGLQDFCEQCNKCARECPCNAIPFGDKIMFNAYEMWKPDMVKCAQYRATNVGGTMCGRCTKTCPWNLEGVVKERPALWSAINLPFTRGWLAKLDDKLGNGEMNPVKKWWWDLDMDDEENIVLGRRTNERPLFFRRSIRPERQILGCYPAEDAPPPDPKTVYPVNRKRAIERYTSAESPGEYRMKAVE